MAKTAAATTLTAAQKAERAAAREAARVAAAAKVAPGDMAEDTMTEDELLTALGGLDDDDDDLTINAPINKPIHETHESQMHTLSDAPNASEIHDDVMPENWAPPAALQAPPPRPGYQQRWVRMNIRGAADPNNRRRQLKQGWRPRLLNTVPSSEKGLIRGTHDAQFGEVIEDGALILCEMPNHLYAQMKAHWDTKRHGQVEALVDDNIVKGHNNSVPGGRGFGPVRVTRSSESGTSRPHVAADE